MVEVSRSDTPELIRFEQEKAAFHSMAPHLDAYRDQFVAVHDGKVVDVDQSRSALVRRFFERFGDTSVYIGYVGQAPASILQATPFKL